METGGTADSSNSGAMIGGTMSSSMYKNGGNLKPIPKGNKGLPKLPESVRNKMGYMAKGGGVNFGWIVVYPYVFDFEELKFNTDYDDWSESDKTKFEKLLQSGKVKFDGGNLYIKKGDIATYEFLGKVLDISRDEFERELEKAQKKAENKDKKYANGGGVLSVYEIKFKNAKGETEYTRTEAYNKAEAMKVGKFFETHPSQFMRGGFKVVEVNEVTEDDSMAKGGGTKLITKKTKTMDKKWSKKIDKAIKAKKPGFRKSPSGGYYEYRSNRSDVNPKMKLEEGGGTGVSSDSGEFIGGENQSSMYSEGGNIGGFNYTIGGL